MENMNISFRVSEPRHEAHCLLPLLSRDKDNRGRAAISSQ